MFLFKYLSGDYIPLIWRNLGHRTRKLSVITKSLQNILFLREEIDTTRNLITNAGVQKMAAAAAATGLDMRVHCRAVEA